MKPTTLAPLLFSVLPSLAAAQGFYSTCYSTWSLGYHHSSNFIVARCPSSASGGNTTSAIDLQDCLANHEGTLQAGRLGHALYTCRDCAASAADATISCQCANSHNDYLPTSLDLGVFFLFLFPFRLSGGISKVPALDSYPTRERERRYDKS